MSSMSEVFWVGFYSSVIGLIVAIMASCYKSKCSKVDIGCIHIERDITVEEELDQNPIQSNARL
jgi:hypothetical protein